MNYLLIGYSHNILGHLGEIIKANDKNFVYSKSLPLDRSECKELLNNPQIDCVIVDDLENFLISKTPLDIRYLENYRFLIDNCVQNNIKHLHIIENASKIYNGFIKPSKDYRYKEDDDIFSNDLESLNHLFIKKYAEHISKTTSLTITISRYCTIYPNFITDPLETATIENRPCKYVEDNLISSYTCLMEIPEAILEIIKLNEFGVYNLPCSLVGTKTDIINFMYGNRLYMFNIKVKKLKNATDYYLLDDSKIMNLLMNRRKNK